MLNNNNLQIEFLLKEYDALRLQIDSITKELFSLERWALISSGTIWSWLATTSNNNVPHLIYWAPAIITILLCLRGWGLHSSNMLAGKYIANIESYFELPENMGWESLLKQARPLMVVNAAILYWVILIVMNIIIPFITVSL